MMLRKLVDTANFLRQRLGLVLYLARMEFLRRFSGTVGGGIWMFVGPIATIFTIWFAMEFGLAVSDRFGGGIGPSLAVGLCAWLFFVDAVQSATTSITSNPHLVKKVVFPVWVLPLAATLSAFVVHLAVFCLVLAVFAFSGVGFSLNLLTLLFWMACLLLLAAVTGLALATLNVRYREVSVIGPNVLSLMFWLTPIVWQPSMLSANLKDIFLANPMATIIGGYRSVLGLTDQVLPSSDLITFAAIMAIAVVLSLLSYRRRRPDFADNL